MLVHVNLYQVFFNYNYNSIYPLGCLYKTMKVFFRKKYFSNYEKKFNKGHAKHSNSMQLKFKLGVGF